MGSSTNIWSFHNVAESLRRDGHTVLEADVPPFDAPSVRARYLAKTVDRALATTGAKQVHVIAHSMGGLDARVMIGDLGYGDRVKTLTTIATPHRGSNLADVFLKLVPGDADRAIDTIARTIGKTFNATAESTNVRAAMQGLAESGMPAFNASHPDDPRVFYQSWAGVSNVGCLPNPDLNRESEACEGKLLRHRFRLDCMDPLLMPSAAIVAHGTKLLPNDGISTVASSKWGTFRGCVPADHLDEVGQIDDGGMSKRTGFDHLAFYRTMAFELAARE
jgi:triacylglycerol lipase